MTNETNSAATNIVHATLKSIMHGLFDAAKEFTDTQAIDIIDCTIRSHVDHIGDKTVTYIYWK